MKQMKLFSLTDFARLARVSRDTLCHYDRIGLLTPVSRDENNHRYYSGGQIAGVNLIRTLKALGFTLSEIKAMKDQRNPEDANDMLLGQIDKIDQKIEEWTSARRLLSVLHKTIYPVLNIDENAITIQSLKEEPIILGELNDYHNGNDGYDALFNFYKALDDRYPGLDLNYPVWGIFSEKRIKKGDWDLPDRYYFYNPIGREKRPAALYAVGYMRSGYGQCDELYKRLTDYINENGYEICGDAYEEYPLNEICILDDTNYLIRVMITVREKAK